MLGIFSVNAQTYREGEKEILRKLLRMYDNSSGSQLKKTNLDLLGLTPADTLNWNTSEKWIDKLDGLSWNNSNPKRLTKIDWNIFIDKSLKIIDLEPLEYLEYLGLYDQVGPVTKSTANINFQNNLKLKTLKTYYIKIDEIGFSKNTELENISITEGVTYKLDFSTNKKLKNLTLTVSGKEHSIDLSKNTELENLNISNSFFSHNIDLKNNKKLKRIKLYYVTLPNPETLNISGCDQLTFLECNNLRLQGITFPPKCNLDSLICPNNSIKEVTLPISPNLSYINFFLNKLKTIDVRKYNNLKVLNVMQGIPFEKSPDLSNNTKLEKLYFNGIEQLDFTNFPLLDDLACYNYGATKIDLSKNSHLKQIEINGGNVSELILPETNRLENISIYECKMTLSNLPLPLAQYQSYAYTPQAIIDGGEKPIYGVIDLSNEYLIGNNKTSYKWSVKGIPINLASKENGKFVMPSGYAGQDFVCEMINSTFPGLVSQYRVKSGTEALKYDEDEKQILKRILKQHNTQGYNKVYNYKNLGLTEADTLSWNSSEEWVDKVKGLSWDNSTPKQLVGIDWSNYDLYPSQDSIFDFSNLVKLEKLHCSSIPISKIKLNQDISLQNIYLYHFSAEDSTFYSNINIDTLIFVNGNIEHLDLSKNTKLKNLNCSNNNGVIDIDLSKNTALEYLDCSYSFYMQSVNLKNCKQLKHLNLSFVTDGMKTIDITQNKELVYFNCEKNNIEKLDASQNTKLDTLICRNNKMTDLILPTQSSLSHLDCSFNSLEDLDISKQVNLVTLSTIMNKDFVGSWDLSKHTKLKNLYCNGIDELNISKCEELEDFSSYNSTFTVLDLTNNSKLKTIEVSENTIDSIVLPKNNNLENIYLTNNKLKFSTLPLPSSKYKSYAYSPQDTINAGTIASHSIIDLSSEALIDGKETKFVWYVNDQFIQIPSSEKGKFVLKEEHASKSLKCKMTNSVFPNLEITYLVEIGEAPKNIYNEEDVEGLKALLSQATGATRSAKSNYHQFGITDNEMKNWNKETLTKVSGLEWTDEIPKRIKKIDWNNKGLSGNLECAKFDSLYTLECENNHFLSINVSNNKKLKELNCSNNDLTELSLSNNTSLKVVLCQSNNINSISIPTSVEVLNCKDNDLSFATLPHSQANTYDYTLQTPKDGGTILAGYLIDLSKDYSINNTITKYDWYSDNKAVVLQNKGNGIFAASKDLEGKKLLCKMTNDLFPGLVLQYTVTISATSGLDMEYGNNSISLLSNIIRNGEPVKIINKTSQTGIARAYSISGKK